MSELIAAVEGTVKLSFSERDICVCCSGPHVYGAAIEGIEGSGGGWLHKIAYRLPDGQRVRISVELLEDFSKEGDA